MLSWITRHWPAIAGAALGLPGAWSGFKWLLDWGGRIDVFRSWGGGLMDFLANLPPWANVLLILVGMVLIWWDLRGRPGAPASTSLSELKPQTPSAAEWDMPLQKQFRARFQNETVLLDGHEFIECTFENVTFKFDGTKPFRFTGKNSGNSRRVTTDNPVVGQTLTLSLVLRPDLGLQYDIANAGVRSSSNGAFAAPSITDSVASLLGGLYVNDIRFTFAELKKNRHSELTMRVFNASGRAVEIKRVTGQITFSAPNSNNPATTGTLPPPSLRADSANSVEQLQEWFLIFSQPVNAVEADKLLAMKRARTRILFDLSGLNIEVLGRNDQPRSPSAALQLQELEPVF